MEPWKIWFLLWAILSIIGIIFCGITNLWILFGVFIFSLIVCTVFYVICKGIFGFYAHVGINDDRYNILHDANQRDNDLNNSRETNYSDKQDN